MKELKQMILTKHSKAPIVQRIILKNRLLEAGNEQHKNIRLAILWGGGAMRGIYGAGVALGFYLMGIREVFDQYFAISAGAANAGYLLANQSGYGLTIYLEDLRKLKFINFSRALINQPIVNIDYVDKVLRSVKPLNCQNILKSRPELYVGVQKADDGSFHWVNAKANNDVVKTITCSCALLVLSNKPRFCPQLDAKVFDPGASLPAKELIKTYGITDLVVIHNREIQQRKSELHGISKKFCELKLKKFSPQLRNSFFNMDDNFNKSIDWLLSEECEKMANIGIICPQKDKLTRTTKNLALLKESARNAAIQTIEIFKPDWSQEKINSLVYRAIP